MWALKEDMPFEVIPPLPEVKWEGPVLYAFGRGVYREVRRILP